MVVVVVVVVGGGAAVSVSVVFNCLHNQAPQYPVDLCQSVSSVASRQYLHSVSRGLVVVPRHCLSNYGWRAFSVAGPVIWNLLPV